MSVALQRKVQKILESKQRIENPAVQQAIVGLSSLQSSPSSVGGGDNNYSSTAPSPSLAFHRHFRPLLEARSVALYQSLIDEFGAVQHTFGELERNLDTTASIAKTIADQLKEMKSRSNQLLQASEGITHAKAEVASKKELVDIFLKRFQLDANETRILHEADESSIGEEFFATLSKITDMKKNVEAMLGGSIIPRTPHQLDQAALSSPQGMGASNRISLDLLDSLSKQLEVGYEKLYRYIQNQLNAQLVVKTSDLQPKFVHSFELLRNVPVYFEHCLSDFLSSRRSLLIERFLKALSRGSAGARPIELSAHDPVRYCSDMLAWVHQALASEKEFLLALFPPKDTIKSPQPPQLKKVHDLNQVHDYQIYLSSIFEAISRPLRVRIEQSFSTVNGSGGSSGTAGSTSGAAGAAAASATAATSATHSQIETVFKIWNILKFYRVIIDPILPRGASPARPTTLGAKFGAQPSSATPTVAATAASPTSDSLAASIDLLSTLSLLSDHARTSFFHLLGVAGSRLTRVPGPAPTADLGAGQEVSEWIAQLASLMNIYNSSLVSPTEKEAEFEDIMNQIMDPLLKHLKINNSTESASAPLAATSALSEADQLIYSINVLHSVLNVCFTYPSFVSRRIETLNFLVTQQVEKLVLEQTRSVWQKANLAKTVSLIMEAQQRGTPLNPTTDPSLSVAHLTQALKSFYSSLLSVGAFIVPQCDRLNHTPIRRQARVAIAQLISKQYRTVYSALTTAGSGFDVEQMLAIFVHSPQHVDLLLDLQGANSPIASSSTLKSTPGGLATGTAAKST